MRQIEERQIDVQRRLDSIVTFSTRSTQTIKYKSVILITYTVDIPTRSICQKPNHRENSACQEYVY